MHVGIITMEEVHILLKEWLRNNPGHPQREYVGIGFMSLKKRIYEDGDMTNTRVMIHDEDYRTVAAIETYEFWGPFKKIYKVRHNEIRRCDFASKVLGTVKYCFNVLWDMLKDIISHLPRPSFMSLTGVSHQAIGWK